MKLGIKASGRIAAAKKKKKSRNGRGGPPKAQPLTKRSKADDVAEAIFHTLTQAAPLKGRDVFVEVDGGGGKDFVLILEDDETGEGIKEFVVTVKEA